MQMHIVKAAATYFECRFALQYSTAVKTFSHLENRCFIIFTISVHIQDSKN